MSDAVVLKGATFNGAACVSEVPAPGMITLKGDLSSATLRKAVKTTTGVAVPGIRGIGAAGEARLAWMAPDELLLMLPRAGVAGALNDLGVSLADEPHLTADVSDMRAVFRIEGGLAARETLAKLCPVDLAPGVFGEGEVRRTRLSQIPAAFWMDGEGFTLICFRSVAQYAFDVLRQAADDTARVEYFSES